MQREALPLPFDGEVASLVLQGSGGRLEANRFSSSRLRWGWDIVAGVHGEHFGAAGRLSPVTTCP